ncbi:MAG: carbamoyltransferase HypF [Deltaproteobacteria bacterium]|nr:carbamoyltransferase HypF [Deltaproteobacteria bacterium]
MRQRRRLALAGLVQGVGFRPFVFRLAREYGLCGTVGNGPEGVIIEIQGPVSALDAFTRDLTTRRPPLAHISACREESLPPREDENDFRILRSVGADQADGHEVLIGPDVSMCEECLAEIRDPANRRHNYAFTNCSDCGPRYSITRFIPYDRAATSMNCFPMCPQCQKEYDDPQDRRFHAQPNACPLCGPKLWTARPGDAATFPDAPGYSGHTDAKAVAAIAGAMHAGKIAAIKGLGGFHLACDATNPEAVAELRRRKNRPHKALAIMCPNLDEARKIVRLGPEEESLLRSPERPIVVCEHPYDRLAPGIAPDDATLGVMLPYAPLHHVLLAAFSALRPADAPIALVMTSGNAGGEPLCLGNREALRRLAHIADIFLCHNRDILIRADDSVARPAADPGGRFYRRARGYAPRPLRLGSSGPCVLGAGAELKSTLCVTRGEWAFMGQHVGDLQNPECLGFYRELLEHLPRLLQVKPEAVVCDTHPEYWSTRLARESGLPAHALQHHFAHVWSVLAEHGIEGAALGLALDGAGYGDDGTIWGGELVFVDTQTLQHQRLGRLSPFALPGGEAAMREPWRIAQGFLESLGEGRECAWPWLESGSVTEGAATAVAELVRRGVNCPLTSSCGRLFDAAAALLGLCIRAGYEGQAAIRLESAQTRDKNGGDAPRLDFPLREQGGLWELDSRALMSALIRARMSGGAVGALARAFHVSLARGFADMALAAARQTGVWRMGLSGGVLQNATLAGLLTEMLLERGLTPLTHKAVPANDGGLALGQAAWGRRFFK